MDTKPPHHVKVIVLWGGFLITVQVSEAYVNVGLKYDLYIKAQLLFVYISGDLHRLADIQFLAELKQKYGNIIKISGIPGKQDFIFLYDADEIEKVSNQHHEEQKFKQMMNPNLNSTFRQPYTFPLINLYSCLIMVIISIIIRVFCPKADPSLQAEKPRLQFCRREVFHRKPLNQGCSFATDLIGAVASRCFLHLTLSLESEQTSK